MLTFNNVFITDLAEQKMTAKIRPRSRSPLFVEEKERPDAKDSVMILPVFTLIRTQLPIENASRLFHAKI